MIFINKKNMKSLNEEITRIKQLLLYEAFGGSQNMIPKYFDTVVRKTNLEKIFNKYLSGDSGLKNFKKTMINKIQSGEYGDDFSKVSKNLQYLKYSGAVIVGLSEIFDNDQDGNIEESIGKNFQQMAEANLLGEWCQKCKSKEDAKKEIAAAIGEFQRIKSMGKNDFEKWIKKRFGDPLGDVSDPLRFFTAHGTRVNDIAKKWGLQGLGDYEGSEDVKMGDYKVGIEFLDSVEIKSKEGTIFLNKEKGGKLPTEYNQEEKTLIHKNKNGDLIYFDIDVKPRPNVETTVEVLKVNPRRGGYIEHRSLVVKFGSKRDNKINIKILK